MFIPYESRMIFILMAITTEWQSEDSLYQKLQKGYPEIGLRSQLGASLYFLSKNREANKNKPLVCLKNISGEKSVCLTEDGDQLKKAIMGRIVYADEE